MIIILIAINMIGIFPSIYFTKEQEFSLYPTAGEFYEYELNFIRQGGYLNCKMHPQVPNVQLNQFEEIYRTKGNQFISMSSNNTHFGTLSNENEVVIYEWKNEKIQQVGESFTFDSSFNCFNIYISLDFSILVDCYQNNEFFLIQLMDAQSIISYSLQSSVPTSTKIQSIVNGTNAFIIYAQYFDKYSILSLFSLQFINQSSLNNQFVDFDIPITLSPNIYVITFQEILQLSISPNSHFQLKYKFSQDDMGNFTTINVFYNLWTYSQCDKILLIYYYQPNSTFFTVSLWGCENQIIMKNPNLFVSEIPTQKILQNKQFEIYQQVDTIVIIEQLSDQFIYFFLSDEKNSLLYLNADNELFSFNQDILAFKIQLTSLQVNYTDLEITGNTYTFQLICQNLGQFTYSKFYLQQLPQNDTNIFVIVNQDQLFLQEDYTQFNYYISKFYSFSGQLLKYRLNQNETYYNSTSFTFQNLCEMNQSYQLVQVLPVNYFQFVRFYLIGYNNQSLDILYCIYNDNNQSCQQTVLFSTNISVNANALQVAFNIYSVILIGLSTNDTIYFFQYSNPNNSLIIQSSNTFEQQFSDFLVTYNSIIILIPNIEIQILNFNFINTFTLNQESINKLFKNIQFNPIQIVTNKQLQSSFLYINNINEVIIISIDQNSLPIPFSFIKVNFIIKQINLVSQQLILSYLCNNNNKQNICFSVWNVQNLPKYYYLKNLQSLNFDNKLIIQSDNLFLYVTFSNYTVYVYNPQLPYHMSLYYMLELTSPIQCAQSLLQTESYAGDKSIIVFNNNYYFMNVIQIFNLSYKYSNYDLNHQVSYPQFIYNYSVTSLLNGTAIQYTPNTSVTFYLNFSQFQDQTNLSINLSLDNIIPLSKNFSYPMNLILDRQFGYCRSQDQNKYCSLTQFSHNSNSIFNFQKYSLILSINNEFFALQTNSYIQTVNGDLYNLSNFNYQNLSLNQCLKSTSRNYKLYSICQNSTSQYLLNFTLNSFGQIVNLKTKQLPQIFFNISKIESLLNQLFILGSLDQEYQQLYWFNQFNNNFQSISYDVTDIEDFSIEQIQATFEDNQSQQIIIFAITDFTLDYRIMLIQDEGISLLNTVQVQIRICHKQLTCDWFELIYYNQILIMFTFEKNVIILVSDNYLSYIIQIRIEKKFSYSSSDLLQTANVIRTIPNYGNLNNTANSFYQNGVLMQQFTYQGYFIVGVYFLNNLLDENLIQPILMQGSFNTTIADYAMIVNQQYQNGTSLYFYNQQIKNYSISTWNLTCLVNTKDGSIDVSIFCWNEFSNGIYYITFFLPPKFRYNLSSSVYALFSMIGLLLLYFFIKVKQKIKNQGYIRSEIEL